MEEQGYESEHQQLRNQKWRMKKREVKMKLKLDSSLKFESKIEAQDLLSIEVKLKEKSD